MRRAPLALVLLACALAAADAHAYIDPNAGGLLYQILFPLIVAIGAAWAGLRHRIGYWWSLLRNALSRRPRDGKNDEPHQ